MGRRGKREREEERETERRVRWREREGGHEERQREREVRRREDREGGFKTQSSKKDFQDPAYHHLYALRGINFIILQDGFNRFRKGFQ